MKQAIIDIGSNSIRLTVYETEGQSFRILFREKIMAGPAGYVEDGKLSAEGIECACAGLLTFRKILQTLQIENVRIFATASLRNISNTARALSVIARRRAIRLRSSPARTKPSSATREQCASCT